MDQLRQHPGAMQLTERSEGWGTHDVDRVGLAVAAGGGAPVAGRTSCCSPCRPADQATRRAQQGNGCERCAV
jgi:hypothetical protein